MKSKTFYSNGKLLISGEYVVLDGAKALAVPTKQGQSLKIEPLNKSILKWSSFDYNNTIWYEAEFMINESGFIKSNKNDDTSSRLVQILNAAKSANPKFLSTDQGYQISTHLDFPRNWGLGTSSTLINNISQWAEINPFALLEKTFGGSGYDIACAQNNSPITYKIVEQAPIIKDVEFNPKFKRHLYFVYLNVKKNSRDGIKHYRKNKKHLEGTIKEINKLTAAMISCENFDSFSELMNEHENIISQITNQTPVKQLFFKDFMGSIKSLGAWGGDFVLVASHNDPAKYFKSIGYDTIIPYSEMVL